MEERRKTSPAEIRNLLFAVVILWIWAYPAKGNIFEYEPISEANIASARISVDFAEMVAHRSILGYETNFLRLIDTSGSIDDLDLSDVFFGDNSYPDMPLINMGQSQTCVFSADIDSCFFPVLATGKVGLNFLFTDTDDGMFAIDFISINIETDTENLELFYGWPIGNENNGFGLGIEDGADLPAPLSFCLSFNSTHTGFDEIIGSKTEVPEPACITILTFGTFALLLKRRRLPGIKSFILLVLITMPLAFRAKALNISDVNLYQMDFNDVTGEKLENTQSGDLHLTINPDDDPNYHYLNLWIRENENYPSYWVVKNIVLPSGSQIEEPFYMSHFFSLKDVVQDGNTIDSLDYQIQFTEEPLEELPVGGSFTNTVVLDGFYSPGSGSITDTYLDFPETLTLGFAVEAEAPVAPEKPKPVVYKHNLPAVEEGVNECGPGSVARSLCWLYKEGKINLDYNDINKLMSDLKSQMLWDPNGVRDQNFLKGKLSFAKEKKLDLNIKFMHPNIGPNDFNTPSGKAVCRGTWPTPEFIKNEIAAGEDVEIGINWMDSRLPVNDPNRYKGGHWVTVAGCDVNSNQLWITDDPNQGHTNKTRELIRRRLLKYLKDPRWLSVYYLYSSDANVPYYKFDRNYVSYVVSESPKPKVDQFESWFESMFSFDLAIGSAAKAVALVQNDFNSVPFTDVEFKKCAGDFSFNNGFVMPDGSKTSITTNEQGYAVAEISGNSPGPALIQMTVTGTDFTTYSFFDVIECPLNATLDNDCDVDMMDFALFADSWLQSGCGDCGDADINSDGSVSMEDLGLFCPEWLAGK